MADIKNRIPTPTEDVEQINLFRWAEFQSGKYAVLRMMYHTPNGGKRGKAEAGRFRAMGVKAGVPDIFLPYPLRYPDRQYCGLYIELKRQKGGTVSPEQKEWLRYLRAAGYAVEVCRGWEAAAKTIMDYMHFAYTPSQIDQKDDRRNSK